MTLPTFDPESRFGKILWRTFVTIFVAGPILVALLYVVVWQRIDAKDNATRCAVVSLVQDLTGNSQRNLKAVLASPSTTAQQKQAAKKNLGILEDALRVTSGDLGHPHGAHCRVP